MKQPSKAKAWDAPLVFLTVAFRGIRSTWVTSLVGLAALSCFAFFLAVFVVISQTNSHLCKRLAAANRLTVYVASELDNKQVDELSSWALSQGAVEKVELERFDSYFSALCNSLSLDRGAFGELPTDLVPAALVLTIDPGKSSWELVAQFIDELKARPDVLDVFFEGDTLLKLSQMLSRARAFVLVILTVSLVCAATVLFQGSLMLVRATEDELFIMKLAGARTAAIVGPYAVYCVLQWASAMAIAAAFWLACLPISTGQLHGYFLELEALFAPRLGATGTILVAIAAALLTLGSTMLALRMRLKRLDPFYG